MSLEMYEIESDVQEGLMFCHKLLQMYISLSRGYENTIKGQGFDTHIIKKKLTSIEKQFFNIVQKTESQLAFIADKISEGTYLSYKLDIDRLKSFFTEELKFMTAAIPVKANLSEEIKREFNGGAR